VAPLAELAATPADLIVIGGGITGTGIARDAALRGLRTVLLEQRDLACGTSGRSSRLVHGGLRYLEHGDFKLVFEALRERAILQQIAPHLVRPLSFVFPLHQGDRLPLWKLAAGMWLYDLLALFRNVRRHQMLGKRALLEREPALRTAGLKGAARYFDAQCDDARLVVATARSARAAGAAIRTWTTVTGFLREGGRVTGVVAHDVESGTDAELRAAVVVNATGPWVDAVRRLEQDGAVTPLLRRTKGAHVVVPRARIGHTEGITFLSPLDGRVMFVLPWGDWSYIGTTDTDTAESPDAVAVTPEDVRYLLRSANSRFPSARLSEDDVIATWAGLRPLIDGSARAADAVSREHAIVDGPGGVLTVAGGKLTTYRAMAAEVVDRIVQRIPPRDGRPGRPNRPRTGSRCPAARRRSWPRSAPSASTRVSASARWSTCCDTTARRRRGSTTSRAASRRSRSPCTRSIQPSRPRWCMRHVASSRGGSRTCWCGGCTYSTRPRIGAGRLHPGPRSCWAVNSAGRRRKSRAGGTSISP
jgi:glycerol-3-phosphate dehydrogenase